MKDIFTQREALLTAQCPPIYNKLQGVSHHFWEKVSKKIHFDDESTC
jgi:hypothetical protein